MENIYSFKNITSADLQDPNKFNAIAQSKLVPQDLFGRYNYVKSEYDRVAAGMAKVTDPNERAVWQKNLDGMTSGIKNEEKNILDALNANATQASRLTEKMNDVIANGYKPGTEQYESRLKEYTSFYSQLPDFMKVGNAAPSEITTSSIQYPKLTSTSHNLMATSPLGKKLGQLQYLRQDDGLLQIDAWGGNNKYGFTEISKDEFIKGVQQQIADVDNPAIRNKITDKAYLQGLIAKAQSDTGQIQKGYENKIIDASGNLVDLTVAAKTAEMEALVAKGVMKKVPVGNGFGYLPVGSAGDLYQTDPNAYYAKYGKPQTATYQISGQQQPTGDAVYNVNGKLMSAAAAKAAGADISKLTPVSGSAYVDKLGTTSTSTSASTPTGTIPGMKNIMTGKENVLGNDVMVNQLFKAYHGRDANLQELNYWRNKKIGDLENTLAKTQIFSKEDADKIRAQMQAEGKTYIANQAELEQLAAAGKITPAGLTSVSQQGGMLFQGTPTTSGTGTGGGTGAGTGTTGTGTGTGTGTDATGGAGDATGGNGEDALVDTIANAVGDVNASEVDILNALNSLKNSQIDPYYKQLISQAQKDVTTSINRSYEDRIRQLQTESFNMAENIKNTQKSLEQSGLTFSGSAIEKLGTLAAFGQSTPAGLTPAQLDQYGNPVSGGTPVQNQTLPQTAVGLPTMTAEQQGLEGSVNQQNRLYAESSRSLFNRGLEDLGQNAIRLLGTEGVAGMNLPSQMTAGQPQTTGTMQYDYANTLQSTHKGLTDQEGDLTAYQATITPSLYS